jgi:hypothetical protein
VRPALTDERQVIAGNDRSLQINNANGAVSALLHLKNNALKQSV